MRKTSFTAFLSIIALFLAFTGCKKTKTPPVSERVAKVWTARVVNHSSSTVYTRGGTSNVQPGYSNFKLDLSSPPTVRYTEYDGNTFVGQYSVPSDDRIVLTALNPAPSGETNGTIEFSITGISDTELKLSRSTASQKTGGTINDYTLSNP